MMNTVEIKKGIYWVGAIDWNIRDFHGYKTPHGTTYNAYLVVDEKIALIDTVKRPFKDEFLARVKELVDLDRIDYLVVNHVEMDHSGSFPIVAGMLPNATILATEEGREELQKHFGTTNDITVVDDGDSISLGSKTLQFIKTPMLHWPDSMMSYLVEDHVVFSSDAFGQHFASSERFNDEVDPSTLYHVAGDYYANILWLYSPLISRLIERVQSMGIEIDVIAPDHGVVWRDDPMQIITWYAKWASGTASDRVVIAYDTMWNSTEKMAKAIAEGIQSEGVAVRLMRLRDTEKSYVITEMLESKGVLVGSPTLNNGMYPLVGGFLTYMKGLRPKKKKGAAFGSYGWGGGACAAIEEMLQDSGIDVVREPLELKWVPTDDELASCEEFGREFARSLKE